MFLFFFSFSLFQCHRQLEEVIHAIFYSHQTSGTCAGMCACNGIHQMEKTELHLVTMHIKFSRIHYPIKHYILLSSCIHFELILSVILHQFLSILYICFCQSTIKFMFYMQYFPMKKLH